MQQLFIWLSQSVEEISALALAASLVWGMLSVLLSPCHLAGIPLIVGYILGQKAPVATIAGNVKPINRGAPAATVTAWKVSLLFAIGVLLSIIAIGLVTTLMGRVAGDLGGWANYAVALVVVLVGLQLMEVVKLTLPAFGAGQRSGRLGALALGLVFGVALGPCTFAFMAPVLALAFAAASTAPLFAIALLAAFGVGHCAVLAGAGASVDGVQRFLVWNRTTGWLPALRKASGALVVVGGLYLLYAAGR